MAMKSIETEILVLGGGLAGAFAAIKAKEAGAKEVMLVAKGKLGTDSIATQAAGMYAMATPEDDRDELFKRAALTDDYGAGLCDQEWLEVALEEEYAMAIEMEKYGVEWEKTSDGKFERKFMRSGFGMAAMFHGTQLMEAMARKVIRSDVIVFGHTMITGLLTEHGAPGNRVIGAVGFNDRTGEFREFRAKSIILAIGGCTFKTRQPGSHIQSGEAFAMAYESGAKLGRFAESEGLYVCPSYCDTQGMNVFIGLDGRFVNADGEQFMQEYEPQHGEHASLGTIAGAMAIEVRAGRGPIYLDMTHFTSEDVKKLRVVIPHATLRLERAGIIVGDRILKKMEYTPFFTGICCEGGGVINNLKCETSLPGLYACGDSMAQSRVPPNALPGAAISGARAGRFATEYAKGAEEPKIDEGQVEELRKATFAPLERERGIKPDHVIIGINEVLLHPEVTIISRGDRLKKAIGEIERIRDEEVPLLYASDPHYLRIANETKASVLVAEMYLRSRLLREDSRNLFLREDFPYTDNVNWLKWTMLTKERGKMKLWTEDIPIGKYKVKPRVERYLCPIFEVAKRRGIKWG